MGVRCIYIYHLTIKTIIKTVELNINNLIINKEAELGKTIKEISSDLKTKTTLLYTSRKLKIIEDFDKNIIFGRLIMQSLVTILRKINFYPDYIISKGGITSAEIATKFLKIKIAKVTDKILPGIPVWKTIIPEKFKHIPLVIFRVM